MLQDMVIYLNFASHNVAKNSHCNRILITEGLTIRFDRNSNLQFSVQSI